MNNLDFDFEICITEVEKAFIEFHTLWYTYGGDFRQLTDGEENLGKKRASVIFSSEPLTEDRTTWIELPEYSMSKAWYEGDELRIRTYDLFV